MPSPSTKHIFESIISSTITSYSALFFSQDKILGVLLMTLCFCNPIVGIYSLVSSIIVNFLSILLKFPQEKIHSGYYGFNAILSGIALAVIFPINTFSIFLLFTSTLLVLFIEIQFDNWFEKDNLPFLSLPFIITLWCCVLAGHYTGSLVGLGNIENSQSPFIENSFVFQTLNESFRLAPSIVKDYLLSLSSIFFKNSYAYGLIIAIGLFYHSRIVFTVSTIVHSFAYVLYILTHDFIGFIPFPYLGINILFTSIAIGCYFTIPSIKSIVWSVVTIPLQFIIFLSTSQFLLPFYLPSYTLTFSIITIAFLTFVKRNHSCLTPLLATAMEKSPEASLYMHYANKKRVNALPYIGFGLPFLGEWNVAQGHNGQYTHRGKWQHAWDFNILDPHKKQFCNDGCNLTDYYCYNKPIISPTDAQIVEIENNVDDNEIGKENTKENWGNYIILKCGELYVVLCHFKKGSINVSKGQFVSKYEKIGLCGNSGLSKFPHLHMQIQVSPYIGSKTISYPISNYLKKTNDQLVYKQSDIPKENEIVCNINHSDKLFEAYKITSYESLEIEFKGHKDLWTLESSSYGYGYLVDQNKNKAWFVIKKHHFCFYRYEGKLDAALYYFYLSNYSVLLATDNWETTENIPLNCIKRTLLSIIQDAVAPFWIFNNLEYSAKCTNQTCAVFEDRLVLKSAVSMRSKSKEKTLYSFETEIANEKINRVTVKDRKNEEFSITINYKRY